MPKPFLKKFTCVTLAIIVIFLGVFLFNVEKAQAQPAIGWTIELMKSALGGVAEGIVRLVSWWGFLVMGFNVTISALIFEGVLNFGFKSLGGIEMGWMISRDIVNMFFILGLVVIAFATILRFETYGMKALLPKLIIIALLINFSFLICGVIIDATQIIADYFLDKIEANGSIGLQLLNALRLNKIVEVKEGMVQPMELVNATKNFVRFVVSVCFLFLVLVLVCLALIVGAILLLVRIGALWILMILAPFAWFFSIFPGLKAMSKKWWDNFLKYAFFAPIYVFFIYLILYISPAIFSQAQTVVSENVDKSFLDNLKEFGLTQMAGDFNLIFGFVFVVMLLLGAPVIATSMGLHATNAITKGYQGIIRGITGLPLKGLKYAASSAWKKFDRDFLAPRGISPRVLRTAWKMRRERIEEEKLVLPIGEMYDKLNRWFGEGKTFNAERARDLLREKEQGLIRKQNLSLEEIGDIANEAKKAIVEKGQVHLIPKFQAAVMEAVDRADEEGLMGNAELGAKYKHLTSLENYQQLIKDTILDEKEAIRFAGQVGALAKLHGIHYIDGMTQHDSDKKKMDWTPEEKLGEKGAIELSKLSARYIWQNSNRRNFATMYTGPDYEYKDEETGKTIEVKTGDAITPTKLLEKFLKRTKFDEDHLRQMRQYMAPETVHYLGQEPIMKEIRKLVNQVKATNPTAEKWLETLEAKVEGREQPKGKD